MRAASQVQLRTFLVTVDFFSGADRFATERYVIEACNWYRAEQVALELSASSAYDNPLIPNLHRTSIAQEM